MIENKDKKVRQLFIDMDGVLADFESGLSEVLGHKVRLSDVADVYNDRKREVTSKHLFRRLKPLPDAWKLVDWALNSGIHTEILTAAGTINRTIVIKDKMSSVTKNKGIIKQIPLIELLNKKVDLKKKLIKLKKDHKEPKVQEELVTAIAEIDEFLTKHRIQK